MFIILVVVGSGVLSRTDHVDPFPFYALGFLHWERVCHKMIKLYALVYSSPSYWAVRSALDVCNCRCPKHRKLQHCVIHFINF